MKPDDALALLDLLAHPLRFKMYIALVAVRWRGMTVSRLQKKLEVNAASTLSHHVQMMVRAGLITQERQGQKLICRVKFGGLTEITELFKTLEKRSRP